MAKITKTFNADEKSWQTDFYVNLFGEDLEGITIDRSTDGYTRGVLFEQKTNVQSYGESKALSQALIYLARFNRDGVPVPAKICLVGQEEQKCYIYDAANYMNIINNVVEYSNLKASDGIPGFHAGARSGLISFDMSSPLRGMQEVLSFVQQQPQTVKVDINKHNVYGWALYYYAHAPEYRQKPDKKAFFEELRHPKGTLAQFINPWTGTERDFEYIMDMLNDPATQKDLGAFYTPPLYAKKAAELVRQAIERVPEGNDYVIIDRCAGTGNLELPFDDSVLSHVIVSTYELKEWMVLKDRYYGRVRYIIPPVPQPPQTLPSLNDDGFLCGANALTHEIMNNIEVRKYLDDPQCTIILYENPPFVESTQVVKAHGKTIVQKKAATWKHTDMYAEMATEVGGVALNDMGNVFIWSAFKHFLRQPTDSYICFSPIKYWKAQHLIGKKCLGGFAFNRKHFHADATCVTCVHWSNEDDPFTHSISLDSYDISDNRLSPAGTLSVKQVFSTFSDKYYDNRRDIKDVPGGIVCEIDGTLSNKTPNGLTPLTNNNIIGYMVAYKNTFDSPRYCSMLLRGGIYNGHGFYLRADNFVEKLPVFAASRYTDNCNSWQIMSMVMKSADKAAQYAADAACGKLNKFLCQTLIWTGLTHYSHMRSFYAPGGQLYHNELCFDHRRGEPTLASTKLQEFLSQGYELSDEEHDLFCQWEQIMNYVADNCSDEYNAAFSYGLYQIDEEINVKVPSPTRVDKNGQCVMDWKYGDLNNLIKEMKAMLKTYYTNNIVDVLFEYEFLK